MFLLAVIVLLICLLGLILTVAGYISVIPPAYFIGGIIVCALIAMFTRRPAD